MKDFFKFMLASMLGFIIISVILFFIMIGLVASLASFADKKAVTLEPNTMLHMKLDFPVYDRAPKDPFAFFSPAGFDMDENPGLDQILKNLKKAETDPSISGIYLDLSMVQAGTAVLREIRQALQDFKASGKFIVAYGEIYTQGAYYLASVADKIYLHPSGAVEFKGMAAEMVFLKGMLEKLDIEMQVIRHGKYKSAVEMFSEDKMSPENREQIEAILSDMWATALNDISVSRNIGKDKLIQVATSLDGLDASKALASGLIDGLMHADEVRADLKSRTGLGEDEKIKFVSESKYSLVPPSVPDKISANKIAVVYALGSIMGGKGDDRTIGSERLAEAIRQARENKKVKAIVLRVNSPGGSATASEVIRREVELAVKEKPVVVSMGDVAASGGYWISASASRILADPSTITGSIGVFGLIPNMKQMFNDKLGITFDQVKTNENSDFPNVTRPLTTYETIILERQIDGIYNEFLTLVAQGRKMDRSQVDAIGQGRVWSGTDAKEIGLVDEFGGLQDAIRIASELASVTEYSLISLPAQKDPLQQILDELSGNVTSSLVERELGEYSIYYQYLKELKSYQGIMARMPFDLNIR